MTPEQLQELVADTADDLATIFERNGYQNVKIILTVNVTKSLRHQREAWRSKFAIDAGLPEIFKR